MTVAWVQVVERARQVAARYEAQVTLRQLFYRLCVAGVIPNRPAAYRKLSAKLAVSVRAGQGPDLVDLTRRIHIPACWADAGAALADAVAAFRLDRTRHQPVALYLCAEKDTLRVLFEQWTGEFGIPVLVSRGYGSQSYVRQVRDRVRAEQRPAVLAYCGDADASGEDVMRDWIKRTGCWEAVVHIALTVEQARMAQLPSAVGKAANLRWSDFARRHDLDVTTHVQWEIEAMDPEVLQGLVLDVVVAHTDRDALAAVLAEERSQRRALEAAVRAWHHRANGAGEGV